jgi:hypothetical protein
VQRRAEGNPAPHRSWGLSAGEGVVDMAISPWVIVVVACCVHFCEGHHDGGAPVEGTSRSGSQAPRLSEAPAAEV